MKKKQKLETVSCIDQETVMKDSSNKKSRTQHSRIAVVRYFMFTRLLVCQLVPVLNLSFFLHFGSGRMVGKFLPFRPHSLNLFSQQLDINWIFQQLKRFVQLVKKEGKFPMNLLMQRQLIDRKITRIRHSCYSKKASKQKYAKSTWNCGSIRKKI